MPVLSMITKNSWSRCSDILLRVLESTLQIPYNAFILVDDGDDETRRVVEEWCMKYNKEIVYLRSNLYGYHRPTRATARQTAIDFFLKSFNDEWLMFIDDDAVLRDGWWRWIEENRVLSNPSVGEIWGINWDSSPEREKFLGFFGIKLEDYLVKKFHERGGTHDTLYRRNALDGIKIPPELHVYEDAYIHFYVSCRGWISIINPIGVTHYHPASTYTDLKHEKEKAKIAIEIALKYGICEYENAKVINEGVEKRVLAYLSLVRPILGFPPMLLTTMRVYGLKTGIVEAFKRQYLKLWFRWQVLKYVNNVKEIPSPCEAILNR